MQIDPSQVSVNLDALYKWLKLAGYFGLGVTAIVRVSSFASKVRRAGQEFVEDIRLFLKESRTFMIGVNSFTAIVQNNHLHHIQSDLENIKKSLEEAPLARVVREEEEDPEEPRCT